MSHGSNRAFNNLVFYDHTNGYFKNMEIFNLTEMHSLKASYYTIVKRKEGDRKK